MRFGLPYILTAVMGLAGAAQAAPLDYVLLADPKAKACVSRIDQATRSGRSVTMQFFALPKGRFVLQMTPDGLKKSMVSRRPIQFAFEDTLKIAAKAELHKGHYQLDLRSGQGSTDLLVALVNRVRMEARFPDTPEDALTMDLEGIPQMIDRLRGCQEGLS